MTLSEYIKKKEKAIAVLKNEMRLCEPFVKKKLYGEELTYEALDFAVKALEQQPCEDCVSREQAKMDVIPNSLYTSEQVITLLDNLSSVTPTHGTCKDCRWLTTDENDNYYCKQTGDFDSLDWYCADFEKRGSENG